MTARNYLLSVLLVLMAGAPMDNVLAGSTEMNKEIVRKFAAILNEKEFDDLDPLVAPDFVRHCQATPDVQIYSLQDFKKFLRQDALTFPDSTIAFQLLVAEGDYVAFFASYKGTQKGPMGPFPATDKQIDLDFSGVFRFANGKIVELWITWDNLAALTQLGHSPPVPVIQ